MYNASLLNSAPCYAPRLSSSPRSATQGFVMYNATNAATWLTAPQRLATRLRVLRRASIQLKDLFVNLPPLLPAYRLTVARLNSTICLSIYYLVSAQRGVTRLASLPRNSTQRFVYQFTAASLLGSLQRNASQRYSTICLSIYCRSAAIRFATQPFTAQLNDLFVTPRRNVAYSIAALFGSTQRFVCYFASPCIAPQHITLLRADQQRNATICLLLFAPHLAATWLAASRLPATQRFVYYIAPPRTARLLNVTRLNSTQRTET